MGTYEFKCPTCGMTFTGETEEDLKKKKMEHGKMHQSK
jgi:transposase-like protein